jgi:hypothetical protein
VLGLVIAVVVAAASMHDNAIRNALLDRIDAREKALTSQVEQLRTQIEELTGRLPELDQDSDHLRITRKICASWPPRPARRPGHHLRLERHLLAHLRSGDGQERLLQRRQRPSAPAPSRSKCVGPIRRR